MPKGKKILPLLLLACAASTPSFCAEALLEQVIVSASRTPEQGAPLALPWSLIDGEDIRGTAAIHINQLMQRSAGVWISRGNGQESLPSLRSPVLTGAGGCGAFYMAWDGIALRAPGFCNVNQLFDANSEQAGTIEVLRGPGTAVYGANALHGVINVLTADPRGLDGQRIALEAGPDDYYRLRGDLRVIDDRQAFGVYFNGASSGGYKNDAGFDQQKVTLRHDYTGQQWTVVSAVESSNLNQETAGFIRGFRAYEDPALTRSNPNPEAYRDSFSLRGYSRWERDTALGSFSATPYFRRTSMRFLQHFFPWQPVEKNGMDSLGLQLALRGGDSGLNWQLGLDLDLTEAWLSEVQAEEFSPNQPPGVHYDYDVDATSLGIYGQLKWELTPRLALSTGLRLESNEYEYDNRTTDGSACASTASNCRFFRPADRSDDFLNGSLNAGLSYLIAEDHRVFLRAAQGFRPPQAAELYRLQQGQERADLDSETMRSVDLGVRGRAGSVAYELAAFSMRKRDVIFQDSDRRNVSGARTRHKGLEVTLRWANDGGWFADFSASLARHRYDGEANLFGTQLAISGNDIDTAPRRFGSARFGRSVVLAKGRTLRTELEWVHMGRYYLDPENQHEYEGHDLANLRFGLDLANGTTASLRITNLLDEDYAERADFGFGSYRYFVGEPRGAYVELALALP